MTKSVWSRTAEMQVFNKLQEDIETDVLIIGGGMCGILCAYLLEQEGVNYVLAEGKTVGTGITKNTTAKITCQHGLIYDRLIKSAGKEKAGMYLKANEVALSNFLQISKHIDCDLEKKYAYTYSLYNRKKIEDEVKAVNSLGYKADFVEETELPFKVAGAVKFKDQVQFNPLKFLSTISKHLNVYDHTFIKEIKNGTAMSDSGKIKAKKIIVATHFPFINKHGGYFMKMYQERSYVIALENAPNIHGMYIDEDQKGMSFRNYKELLLIGGGDHRTGKKGGNWEELRQFKEKYYPSSKEMYFWATQDCMSLDGIPYIGQYSKSTPNLYVATGFNKWGMSTSFVAAMILRDLVCERTSEFADVFSPDRSIFKPQLFVNGFEAVTGLLTPGTKRCPHLGCALKWNINEHTWDCPCHGSRFEEEGRLIDNPATGDAHVR